MIGNSMIRPLGAAINPRIPASCVKLEMLPRAPESDIMKIGFFASRLSISFCWMLSLAAFQTAITRS